ncbi:MAG: signal peptidase I [bacterium]
MEEEQRENFFTELLKFAFVALCIVVPIRLFILQPFIVSGQSMVPTFQNSQYLFVDELSYYFETPQRGDVIVFHYPKDTSQFFIKRIIGLPGETLHISDTGVTIQKPGSASTTDITIADSYIVNHGNGGEQTYTVPLGEYFVMGDNRPESSDSRVWGFLPKKDIVGRVLLRLLPVSVAALFPGAITLPQ